MHTSFSTAAMAMAMFLSGTANGNPVLPGLNYVTDISSGIAATIPTDRKALAAWAAAQGLGFDPNYVHTASPNEVFNPPAINAGIPSAATKLASAYHGSLPSAPGLSARVVGTDDRYQYTNADAYPWRAVGQVQWSNGVFCTGQLIGSRHVLTAKHCIPQATGQNVSFRFAPSYDRGPNAKFGWGQVTNTVFTPGTFSSGDEACDVRYDGAVAIIDQKFGDSLGYFGAQIPDNSSFNRPIFTTMGYPGDKDNGQRPYRQDGSSLIKPSRPEQFSCDKKTGPIWSDSDISGGQSGSALWRDGNIVWGVCSVSVNNQVGWASGDALLNTITTARNNYR